LVHQGTQGRLDPRGLRETRALVAPLDRLVSLGPLAPQALQDPLGLKVHQVSTVKWAIQGPRDPSAIQVIRVRRAPQAPPDSQAPRGPVDPSGPRAPRVNPDRKATQEERAPWAP